MNTKCFVLCTVILISMLSGCVQEEVPSSEEQEPEQDQEALMSWEKEPGTRIDEGVSSSTIVIDGTYVMYYTSNGIQIAQSSDGLIFEHVGVAIENGQPDSLQMMVSNSAIIELQNGSYRMIYEGQDANHDRRLFSAFSEDGFTWNLEEGIRFQEEGDGKPGELFVSVPDILRTNDGDLLMYYTRGISSAIALSSDEGLTWAKQKSIDLGRIVIDPDIVQLYDGSYTLFFTTFDEEFGVGTQYIMSASSTDGFTFTLDDGKRLEPDEGHMLLLDPDIIELSDGSYRMYYSEMQQDETIIILSAITL